MALLKTTVFSCGSNKSKVLAFDDTSALTNDKLYATPLPINDEIFQNSRIVKVFSGYNHSILLDEDGKAYGVGSNLFHQLGVGSSFAPKPTLIKELASMVIVNCILGYSTSIFENDRGELFGVGHNLSLELGIDNDYSFHRIVPLDIFNSRPNLFKLPFKQIVLGQDMFNNDNWSAFLTRDSRIFIANPRVFDAKYVKKCFSKNNSLYKLKTELFTTDIIEKITGSKKRLIILTQKGNIFRQKEKKFSKLTLPLKKNEIVEDVFDSDYFELYRTSHQRFYGAGFSFTSVSHTNNDESVALLTFNFPPSIYITNIYFGQKTLFFNCTDRNLYSMGFNSSAQSGIGEVYQLVKSPHKVLLDYSILKNDEMFAVAPGYSHSYFYVTRLGQTSQDLNLCLTGEYLFKRHLHGLVDTEIGYTDLIISFY